MAMYHELMDTYCFVCNRPTDHRAEHDDLVEAGRAEYSKTEEIVYLLA